MNAGDVVPLHEVELWALTGEIEELEAELAEARAPQPIRGGPPPDWDRWILALPDEVFADCLGPRDGEDRQPRRPLARADGGTVPVAPATGWKAAAAAVGWR